MTNKYYTMEGMFFRKVLSPNAFIQVSTLRSGKQIEHRHYSTGIQDCFDPLEWQPCEPELFYQAFAEVSAELTLMSGIDIMPLVEGGAYAD